MFLQNNKLFLRNLSNQYDGIFFPFIYIKTEINIINRYTKIHNIFEYVINIC